MCIACHGQNLHVAAQHLLSHVVVVAATSSSDLLHLQIMYGASLTFEMDDVLDLIPLASPRLSVPRRSMSLNLAQCACIIVRHLVQILVWQHVAAARCAVGSEVLALNAKPSSARWHCIGQTASCTPCPRAKVTLPGTSLSKAICQYLGRTEVV
jgi:hypothetical protein